jgi:acetyl-CoA acetyltransferase
MTKFGKHPDRDAVDLAVEAVNEAIRDAGVDRRRIQAAYCGHVYGGMVLGQKVLARTGLAGIPLANVENACSSGATAIREAYLGIRAGEYDLVLAFGVEHLTTRFRGALTPGEEDLEGALGLTMPAVYAMRAVRHMEEFGTTREELAYVSVKNKRNASLNPYAQFQKPVTVEDVLNSRPIADPLRLLDCCPVSDGAAAVVLASERLCAQLDRRRAVRLAAAALRTGTVEVGLPSMAFEPLTRPRRRTRTSGRGWGRRTWTSRKSTTASPSRRSCGWRGWACTPWASIRSGRPGGKRTSAAGCPSTPAGACWARVTPWAPPGWPRWWSWCGS